MRAFTRRRFLRAALGAGGALLSASHAARLLRSEALAAETIPPAFRPVAGGEFLGILSFIEEGNVPHDTLIGEGLAGRQTLDLSRLRPETLITPTSLFFVRTRFPAHLRSTANWTIRVRGLVEQPLELKLEELAAEETSMGTHLLECAGNVRLGGFGLMSTARWRGVPMTALVRGGAQRLIQQAVEAELAELLQRHAGRTDAQGQAAVVRNGYLPEREVLTGSASCSTVCRSKAWGGSG